MKRLIIFIMVILLIVVPNKTGAAIPDGYTMIAKSEKDDVTIYAKKKDGLYYDLKIVFRDGIYFRPFWMSETSPSFAPQIIYQDIDSDNEKELIIILTKGHGTGISIQEVYVHEVVNNRLVEVLVDHPLAIVFKNVRTRLTPSEAKISIGEKNYNVDIRPVGIKPENVFKDMSFGGIVKYEVENNQLIARLAAQVSPAHFIGEIVITYEHRGKMYQAKSIEFQQYKSN